MGYGAAVACARHECGTTAGCAHRGPNGEMCWFEGPSAEASGDLWYDGAKRMRDNIVAWCRTNLEAEIAEEVADCITKLPLPNQ